MEGKNIKYLQLTVLFAGSLVISIIGNFLFLKKQYALTSQCDNYFLFSDSLLSAKYKLNEDLDNSIIVIKRLEKKVANFDSIVSGLNSKLTFQNNSINNLTKENQSVGLLKRQLSEVKKKRNDIEIELNTLLKEEAKQQSKVNAVNKFLAELQIQNDELKKQLSKAKNIKASDILVLHYKNTKKGGKITTKARKVNSVSTEFILGENSFADSGDKEIYLLVYDPKGKLVEPSKGVFFNAETQKYQPYTESKNIRYNNMEMQTNLKHDYNKQVRNGKYKLEIYIDGVLSGKKEFILK